MLVRWRSRLYSSNLDFYIEISEISQRSHQKMELKHVAKNYVYCLEKANGNKNY